MFTITIQKMFILKVMKISKAKFMKELMPKNVKNIKKYRGKIPLFYDANIEKELNIYEPVVKLKFEVI